jgi:hypothetical protein
MRAVGAGIRRHLQPERRSTTSRVPPNAASGSLPWPAAPSSYAFGSLASTSSAALRTSSGHLLRNRPFSVASRAPSGVLMSQPSRSRQASDAWRALNSSAWSQAAKLHYAQASSASTHCSTAPSPFERFVSSCMNADTSSGRTSFGMEGTCGRRRRGSGRPARGPGAGRGRRPPAGRCHAPGRTGTGRRGDSPLATCLMGSDAGSAPGTCARRLS